MRVQITFDISSAQDLEDARRILNEDLAWRDAAPFAPPSSPSPPSAPPSQLPIPESWQPTPPELDSSGRAWSAEHHAASHAKTKDGRWRRKKGVTPEVVDETLPDLRSAPPRVASAPAAPLAPPPPPPQDALVPPPAPPVPPAPPAANGPAPVTWAAVMAAFDARKTKYSHDQLRQTLLESMINPMTLYSRPDEYGRAIAVLEEKCPL